MKSSAFKKYKLVIISLIIIVLSIVKVDAATCSTEEKKELKIEANAIEFISSLDETPNPLNIYEYSINITNFSEKFYIIDSTGNRYEYTDEHTDDTIYGVYEPGTTITLYIYGAYNKTCSDELLVTKKISFDYFNYYSNYEECKGIEEFYLCNRTYSGEIESEEWFLQQIEGYRNGTIENIEIEENQEETTLLDLIKNNPMITVIIILIIVALIAFIIVKIKKNKSKIKVDLTKPKKYIFILAILIIISSTTSVKALDDSTNSESQDGGKASSKSAWVYDDDDKGIRITLYRYDGKTLSYQASIDVVNDLESSYCYAGTKARFEYDSTDTITFTCGQNNAKTFESLGTYKDSNGKTKFYFSDIDSSKTNPTWGNKLSEEIHYYFGNDNQSIMKRIKEMFNVTANESDLSQYYIVVEPTISFYNRTTGRFYYGTGYEFLNSDLDTNSKYTDSTYVGSLYAIQKKTIQKYLYNGLYISTNSSKQYIYNGSTDGRYDYYNFINQNKNMNSIVNTSSHGITWDEIKSKKTNQSIAHGLTVFWIGKTAMECNSTCSGKNGDELLKCAENFCSNQSNVTNSDEKAECMIDKCNYEYTKLSCSDTDTNNGNNTTCASQTKSSKETCQIVNKEKYSYKLDCTTYSNTIYPTTLPTTLMPGTGFEYQVKLYGNKTCTVTFDSELWKFNYASSYTEAEREDYLKIIEEFNRLSLSSYVYDSSNANISIKISEKTNGENEPTNKTLKAEEKYYMGSDAVTSTATTKKISSYHKNIAKTVDIKTYITDSSNGTLYNLPGVCISARDNITATEGVKCDNGLGPYNKYFTGIYADATTNNTETKVVHNISGMDTTNNCNYKVTDSKLSCYITVESASGQTGDVLINNEDLVFKLHAVTNNKDNTLTYNLGNSIKLKGETFNNLTEKTIYKNTVTSNTDEYIYGTVTDGTNFAYCSKTVTITPNVCQFEVTTNSSDTKTIKIKTVNDPNAEYSIKDSTSNKWMNLQSKKINSNTKIIVWGRVKTATNTSYCVIDFDGEETEKQTCPNLYKPTEYKKIREYCDSKWQNDTAGYSSSEDCYISCTDSNKNNSCKKLYTCSDTVAIRQYCKVNYQLDGYNSIGNCINDCSCGSNGLKYYYRTISLNNPFPDREAHYNWLGYEEYITNDIEDNTPSTNSSGPEYEIVLDSKRINEIKKHTKKYNSEGNDAYGDFIRVDADDTGSYKSKFIHEDDIEEGGFTTYFTYIEGIKTGG